MEKAVRYGVLGRYTACSTERIEVLSNKIERNHKSAEIIYQRVYVSPRPPPKISFKDNWMCDLDSDVAGSSNDTQRIEPKPQTQLSSLGRPVCGQESAMEIEKRTKSDHDTFGLRETWWSHRHNKYGETRMWTRIHNALRVDTWTCWRRSNWYGETRVGGSKRGARNWFQSAWTVTCSCEGSRTSPSSRTCDKERNSSSIRRISCGLAAKQRLQPIPQRFQSDDPRIGQCGSIRVVRNNSQNTMFSLSILLKSRNCFCTLEDNAWLTANPESFTNYGWRHSFSRTKW